MVLGHCVHFTGVETEARRGESCICNLHCEKGVLGSWLGLCGPVSPLPSTSNAVISPRLHPERCALARWRR